jgi:hypothetical protein
VKLTLAIAAAALVGVGLGLASAWQTVQTPAPLEVLRLGSWEAWPSAGTPEADPYSRARLARTGEVPLGFAEGLEMIARRDDNGRPLHGICAYRLEGRTPPARLWTIGVVAADGTPLPAGMGRRAIGSESVVRAADGTFTLWISPTPRPGNWLSSEGSGAIHLIARLYDTTARTVTAVTRPVMPRIIREECP